MEATVYSVKQVLEIEKYLSINGNGVNLTVWVRPRDHRNEIVELCGGRLIVRVTVFPEAGEANQAVIKLLPEALGVARTDVEIVRGCRVRSKVVNLPLDREGLEGKLALYCGEVDVRSSARRRL